MERLTFILIGSLLVLSFTTCERCYYSETSSTSYTVSCNFWGWGRCRRYKINTEQKSKCCDGWMGSNCSSRISEGPDSAFLMPNLTRKSVPEGSDMETVSCSCANCTPACTTSWTFDGVTVRSDGRLQMNNVSRGSAGTYTCICNNTQTAESKSTRFILTVNYGPDIAVITPGLSTYNKTTGSQLPNITCSCGVCKPQCTMEWTLNGTAIGGNDIIYSNSLSKNDSGRYKCICSNPATHNTVESEHFDLIVSGISEGSDYAFLMPNLTRKSVQEGSDMETVSCSCANCTPACTTSWTFDGVTVRSDGRLQMNNVSRGSAGTYTCICNNTQTAESKSTRFILTVNYGPDIAVITPGLSTYNKTTGSQLPNITCSCGVCKPQCTMEWTLNGTAIGGNDIIYSNSLSKNDSGRYKCICSNPATHNTVESEHFDLIVSGISEGPDYAFLMPNLTRKSVPEGSDMETVSCSCANCTPACTTSWTFDGVTVRSDGRLQMNNVSRGSAGTYTCICNNTQTAESKSTRFILTVNYGPDIAVITPGLSTYNTTTGSQLPNITCSCGVCKPQCTMEWTLNGTAIGGNDIIYSNSLSKNDSGRYKCVCSNPGTLNTLESEHFDLIVSGRSNDGDIMRLCSGTNEWRISRDSCVRSSFAVIEEELEELTRNPLSTELTDVLNALGNLTDSDGEGNGMYPGEVESVTRSLNIIANLTVNEISTTENQSRLFVNVVNNLLNEDKRRSWKSLSSTEDYDGASKLLQSVEVYSESVRKVFEDTNKSDIAIVQSNIVVEARKLDISQQEIEFPVPSAEINSETPVGAKLSLPLEHNSASDVGHYTVAVYKNLTGVLPNGVATKNSAEHDRTQLLNTPVVSLQVFPYRPELKKPLTLVLKHQQPNLSNPKCAHWSFSRNHWETDGCRAVKSTQSETTCKCYHLTNFAVLMSPWSEPTADSTALEMISTVGCSISVICLIVTAAVHILFWRNLKNNRAIILINICLALTATYVIFLAGINKTNNKVICKIVAALLHYMTLVVFCLMLAEGIEIIITVKFVFFPKTRLKWMLPLAWGVPGAIVGLSMAVTQLEGYGTQNFCWLSVENGVIWAFVGPALLIILVNVIFLGFLLRTMLNTKAYKDMPDVEKVKCSARCLCVLVPLMGSTWLLGIFYVTDRTTWMQYVFALCNGLQGFFIFLFHGLLNKQLRNTIQSRHKQYKDSQSVTKTRSTRRKDVTCPMNPVYSSDEPVSGSELANPNT